MDRLALLWWGNQNLMQIPMVIVFKGSQLILFFHSLFIFCCACFFVCLFLAAVIEMPPSFLGGSKTGCQFMAILRDFPKMIVICLEW